MVSSQGRDEGAVWGRSSSAEVAPYNAAKSAVEGLTLPLARELPPPDGGGPA